MDLYQAFIGEGESAALQGSQWHPAIDHLLIETHQALQTVLQVPFIQLYQNHRQKKLETTLPYLKNRLETLA